NHKESELPVDQHMLLSLIAPRMVYVASASEDEWADPESEFLSLKLAEPVYGLYGFKGIEADTIPPVQQPIVGKRTAYHLREGGHDLTEYDWQRFMDVADRYL